MTNEFDAEYVAELASKYPDKVEDWSRSISKIDSQHKLNLERSLPHSGCIYRASISFDGTMMATVSSSGTLKIWDLRTLSEIAELVDRSVSSNTILFLLISLFILFTLISRKRKLMNIIVFVGLIMFMLQLVERERIERDGLRKMMTIIIYLLTLNFSIFEKEKLFQKDKDILKKFII